MDWNKIIPEHVHRPNLRPPSRLDNKQLVKQYPKLAEKKAKYIEKRDKLKKRLDDLFFEMRQTDLEISELSRVNEIFEGVALDVKYDKSAYGKTFECRAVAWHIDRYAKIYCNCYSNGKLWGLNTARSGWGMHEHNHGFNFNDFDELVLKAKLWVACGIDPTTGNKSL